MGISYNIDRFIDLEKKLATIISKYKEDLGSLKEKVESFEEDLIDKNKYDQDLLIKYALSELNSIFESNPNDLNNYDGLLKKLEDMLNGKNRVVFEEYDKHNKLRISIIYEPL